jgi:L,D-peptidoglycan transpeptidase YkuD (ErfK/YbiS/YcfS/YnhG family)
VARSLASDWRGKQSLSLARRGTKSGIAVKRRRVATVSALSASASRGRLTLGSLTFPCALGRTGCRAGKRESDGATPVGLWRVRALLYRPDRVRRPRTQLPVRTIRLHDGWCDAPADRNYNRLVGHPYPASAERLWRADELYDVVVVLGYNDRPRVRGRGSAIFMHVVRSGYAPTEGCIALARAHLLRLLERLGSRPAVAVAAHKKSARSFRSGR